MYDLLILLVEPKLKAFCRLHSLLPARYLVSGHASWKRTTEGWLDADGALPLVGRAPPHLAGRAGPVTVFIARFLILLNLFKTFGKVV